MIRWRALVTPWAVSGVFLLFGGATALAQMQTDDLQKGRALADSQSTTNLQRYSPTIQVSGLIRVFGNNYIPDLMRQWEEDFRKLQPGVQFETRLPGSEAAMAGLYGGIADLAFIGRESYPSEPSRMMRFVPCRYRDREIWQPVMQRRTMAEMESVSPPLKNNSFSVISPR